MGKSSSARKQKPSAGLYDNFDQLDGDHPWKKMMPEGRITYPVRRLGKGEVVYFNFDLAKEMGLIPEDHPKKLNKKLAQKIIDTFSVRIINEYDQENNIRYTKNTIFEKEFMATRYLQIQHSNKQGKTSGDGRCIWNGAVEHNNRIWDVSSRGTGVTALAPGVVQAGKPLKSGNTDYGYGCGLAEVDELYGTAIMAEIMYNQGIGTERMLAVVDHGRGYGIGVRAGENLLRPAHIFTFLKQGNYEALKRSLDYLISRQQKNKEWKFGVSSKNAYDRMLSEISESFAHFAAQLEREYIFTWLDWDGDNVLANGGIIDYGSIRQFGLRHDQYRYDDIERFSTTLNEQRKKARLIVQAFIQSVDFVKTKNKKPLTHFENHKYVKKYDEHFEYYELDRFLYQMGITRGLRENLLKDKVKHVKKLYEAYLELEKTKTKRKKRRVEDGVNKPAIFNMRTLLHKLPEFILDSDLPPEKVRMSNKEIFKIILAQSASRADSKFTDTVSHKITRFQDLYIEFIEKIRGRKEMRRLLKTIWSRSQIINSDRITGDGLCFVVDEILRHKKKGMKNSEIQNVIDHFIESQRTQPDQTVTKDTYKLHGDRLSRHLMETMLELVEGYKESI